MANAWCINAISYQWCFIQTLQNLDSACIWVWVQFTAPDPFGDKCLDYIKYTDKCGCTCCLTNENEILIYTTQWVIKNFTLTNDDTNDVVNVKRSDIFWSNWNKTIVRYKTWSFPVSITDWTLAVEETTMNQYASSWYNVSWLADETTYYFSAFAIDNNSNVINSQQASIRTSFVPPITTPWIYRSSDLWLISLSSDWTNWTTIADRNLWATTYSTKTGEDNPNAYGNFYQWWNNYWFPATWSVNTSSVAVSVSWYWPWNYFSSDVFITSWSNSWTTNNHNNLRWWITWTKEARRWPCPEWFHIFSRDEYYELKTLYETIVWNSNDITATLKIPRAWFRDQTNWNAVYGSQYWYIRTSDYQDWSDTNAKDIEFPANSENNRPIWRWASIRPMKNVGVVPRANWTKLK